MSLEYAIFSKSGCSLHIVADADEQQKRRHVSASATIGIAELLAAEYQPPAFIVFFLGVADFCFKIRILIISANPVLSVTVGMRPNNIHKITHRSIICPFSVPQASGVSPYLRSNDFLFALHPRPNPVLCVKLDSPIRRRWCFRWMLLGVWLVLGIYLHDVPSLKSA